MSLEDAVRTGLAELEPLDPRDRAAADLALLYAEAIDEGTAEGSGLDAMGPKLLAVLTALQLTPAARAVALRSGAGAPTPSNPLDEIRRKREERGA